MHELGIAKDLWQVITEQAKKNNLNKITKVKIKLGEASGIMEDLLRHSLVDHTFPGSIANNAKLEIIKEEIGAKCNSCNTMITKSSSKDFSCPKCKSSDIEVVSGRDVYIDNIEGNK